MKQIVFIFFAFIVVGCNNYYKKSDLLGTWDAVAVTDIETGQKTFLEDDEIFNVVATLDSLYFSEFMGVCAWQIEGDTILNVWETKGDTIPYVIKEISPNKIIIEYAFFNKLLLELKKQHEEK